MKIIFFGTSSFATSPLLSLIRSEHKMLAVVTQPDKKSGRGLVKSFSPAKLIAQKYDLSVYQPKNVASKDFINTLEALKADVFVVAAFGQILPKEVLSIPKLYSINIHPSLLPKYRGAAPVNWAILKGEKISGVTIFKMTEEMDAGDIIAAKKVDINDDDTALSLGDKLSKVSSELLMHTLKAIEKKKVHPIAQNSQEASYAPKLKKSDGCISWGKTSKEILNHIKGMIPWPAAYTHVDRRLIKVWKIKVLDNEAKADVEPGTVMRADNEGIVVRTKDGAVLIYELQPEGKKKMTAAAYCRGHKIEPGKRFS